MSKLANSKGKVSTLLMNMMEVGVRLHFYYNNKKDISRAEELSLSISNSLSAAQKRASSGELELEEVESTRLEFIAKYWQSEAFRDGAVKLAKQEEILREKVNSNVRDGKFDEAISDLQMILKIKEKSEGATEIVETLREIANVMGKKGDLKGALEYYLKAARTDPYSWFDVGYTLGEMQQYRQSVEAYQRFLKKESKSPSAWNNIGWAYQNLQDFPNALESYRNALELDSQFLSAHMGKSWILMQEGKAEQAINAYEEALKVDPKNQSALIALTGLYNDGMQNYEKAAYYAQRAYDVNPSDPSTATNLAESLVTVGRYEEARDQAKKALRLTDNPSGKLAMYLTIAASYFLQEKTSDGNQQLNELKEYLASLPPTFTNEWTYNGITNIINRSGIPDDAKAKLLEAIKSICERGPPH
jgi:tetratricopeptide (TPR) repeat protein